MKAHEILGVAPDATRAEVRAAYRALARRWHPDRFAEGPERDWASEKMAQINAAYRACRDARTAAPACDEPERLLDVEKLIALGEYEAARRTLMAFTTRCAEWNYLFGALMIKLNRREKALVYLSVAAHQNPDSAKYRRALAQAQAQGPRTGLGARLQALARARRS